MLHGLIMPGSTPTQVFELPFSTDELADVLVTYGLEKATLLEKEMRNCILDGNYIIVELSQEDTLKFPTNEVVEVQLKILTRSNKVFVSPSYRLGIEKALNRRVMKK